MNSRTIVENFKKLRVLIIGDVMLDSYIWGSIERISPEAPVPVVSVRKRDYRLGGAANVALNVRALGAQPTICALVGNDEAGQRLQQALNNESVAADGLVVSNTRPTTVKTRIIASHQHVVRIDDESDKPATPEEEHALIEKLKQLIDHCDVIIFEDYDKGALTPAIIDAVIALANKKGIPTVVDPKKRNFLRYKGVTLFKPNLKELREGLKLDVDADKPEQVEQAVEQLRRTLQATGVMLTLSEHGVYIDYQEQRKKIPAHTREIADVSGAGDTVVAIAALCVALRLDAATIASLSNLGGGLVCQHVGVVPINREELVAEAEQL